MNFSQEEKLDLVEGYFCYPISEKENLDYVLDRLAEFHEMDEGDLKEALKTDARIKEFYDGEVRKQFVEN
jgi:hypothetical protein